MKVGIMQPYFAPYIGYWQLMNAVDQYVVYDDVNFIKGGWINRNRILVNGSVQYFNIPMLGASPNKLINEIGVNNDTSIIGKNIRQLEYAYGKAPFFNETMVVMEKILRCNKNNLATYIEASFEMFCDYLNIKTRRIISSSIKKDCGLKGQDKIIAICKQLGATEYYNAIGGKSLYSHAEFKKNGIKLKFLSTNEIKYVQFGNEFESNLSIIDVMMFNSKAQIGEMLSDFTLVE